MELMSESTTRGYSAGGSENAHRQTIHLAEKDETIPSDFLKGRDYLPMILKHSIHLAYLTNFKSISKHDYMLKLIKLFHFSTYSRRSNSIYYPIVLRLLNSPFINIFFSLPPPNEPKKNYDIAKFTSQSLN